MRVLIPILLLLCAPALGAQKIAVVIIPSGSISADDAQNEAINLRYMMSEQFADAHVLTQGTSGWRDSQKQGIRRAL